MVSVEVIRNNNARKFEPSCRIHRGCCRLGRNQSKEHFLAICDKAYDEWAAGKQILTEASLIGMKARADLVVLDDSRVVEIPISEKPERLDTKKDIWEYNGFRMEVI